MNAVLRKFSNFLAHLLHPRIEKKYRYYIADNYLSRLLQLRYWYRDCLIKKPYKEIFYNGEFQQELCFVLPFAYWHAQNGTLKETVSSLHTKELYFFSPHHKEKYELRDPRTNRENFSVPNMSHTLRLSRSRWLPVPLKQHYANTVFVYDKPLLVIANKYNREWDSDPVNFLSLEILEQLFRQYSDRYQIIYNRPRAHHIIGDNSPAVRFNDDELLHQFPAVLSLQNEYAKHRQRVNNFNHLQLMVYANCQHFISVHGGTAALASYFGGTNILYSKNGVESVFSEYQNIFTALSGCKVVPVPSEAELLKEVAERF